MTVTAQGDKPDKNPLKGWLFSPPCGLVLFLIMEFFFRTVTLCVFGCPLRPCWVVFGFGLVWGWCDAEYGFLFDLEIHFQPLKVCNPPSLHRLSQPFLLDRSSRQPSREPEPSRRRKHFEGCEDKKKSWPALGWGGCLLNPYFSPEQDVKRDKIDSVFGLGRIRDDGTKQFFRNDEISDANSGMLRSAKWDHGILLSCS